MNIVVVHMSGDHSPVTLGPIAVRSCKIFRVLSTENSWPLPSEVVLGIHAAVMWSKAKQLRTTKSRIKAFFCGRSGGKVALVSLESEPGDMPLDLFSAFHITSDYDVCLKCVH